MTEHLLEYAHDIQIVMAIMLPNGQMCPPRKPIQLYDVLAKLPSTLGVSISRYKASSNPLSTMCQNGGWIAPFQR